MREYNIIYIIINLTQYRLRLCHFLTWSSQIALILWVFHWFQMLLQEYNWNFLWFYNYFTVFHKNLSDFKRNFDNFFYFLYKHILLYVEKNKIPQVRNVKFDKMLKYTLMSRRFYCDWSTIENQPGKRGNFRICE